ncbi:MAG TPA: Rv3654c family TadE-like protein [Actinomycetota bacterium]|nr:Rv3654c family TadE-like protein [Actinomycetota bacterium]
MRDDRGSVSIVVAGLIAIVVVMAMAAADVVRVLAAASRGQTAADAAALAAAQTLAFPDDLMPTDRAREYAERNDAELESCVCEPGSFEAMVVVRMDVGDLLLFGSGRSVIARARAVVDLPMA